MRTRPITVLAITIGVMVLACALVGALYGAAEARKPDQKPSAAPRTTEPVPTVESVTDRLIDYTGWKYGDARDDFADRTGYRLTIHQATFVSGGQARGIAGFTAVGRPTVVSVERDFLGTVHVVLRWTVVTDLVWNWYQAHPTMPHLIGWTWFGDGTNKGAYNEFYGILDNFVNVTNHPYPNDGHSYSSVVVSTSPKPGEPISLGQLITVKTKLVRGEPFPTGGGGGEDLPDVDWHSPCHITWSVRGGFNLVC
jgi:hypothetical protein